LKSTTTKEFRVCLALLPSAIQRLAEATYKRWKLNPYHGSLHFKPLKLGTRIHSVRIGKSYRALGFLKGDHVTWFWIGPHADYDELLKRF
jgi:hypothetical protein